MSLGRTAALVVMLAALTSACATGNGPGSTAGVGVLSGVVQSSPSCPVQRATDPCPPRVVAGATVELLSGSLVLAHDVTASTGRFQINYRAGSYLVRVTDPGSYHSTTQASVTLVPDSPRDITLILDSGIR